MRKVRVLIIDSSVTMREMISNDLLSDPTIEIAGTASTGKNALEKIPQILPDIITLDSEMPGMNVLEALDQIRKNHPSIPVLMLSSLTERGVEAALDALARGASDYAAKPVRDDQNGEQHISIRSELLKKIKTLTKVVTPEKKSFALESSRPITKFITTPKAKSSVDVVVIGVSTGGPDALAKLIPELPEGFSVPILIVQHMPRSFTKLLADRLDAQSPLNVVEAAERMELQPGFVYIAPGDFHVQVSGTKFKPFITLNKDPPENSCRPAVDPLFRSVAPIYGSHILAVVLTGMGQDGLLGCEKIRKSGGYIIAQDRESSVVWGMPGAVVENGLADKILPLSEIAQEICRHIKNPTTISKTGGT